LLLVLGWKGGGEQGKTGQSGNHGSGCRHGMPVTLEDCGCCRQS
jgi:hypothetical protein